MKVRAALSYGESDFKIEQVSYEEISEDEVLVKINSVGICHTDIVSTKGIYPFSYPVILGHEGAGTVEKTGANVEGFDINDHVILSYASCNSCPACSSGHPYICESFYPLNTHGVNYQNKKNISLINGEKVSNFFGQSSFAEYVVVHKNNVIKVPNNLSLEYLGPLSCGIMTGMGSVLKKLKPEYNQTIAIFGCGTVGLSAIIASKLSNCKTIIAIDVNDNKLEDAKKFGATHVINSSREEVISAIKSIEPLGVDFSIESTGIPSILQQTIDCLKIPGKVAVLSAVKHGTKVEIDYKSIQTERTIVGVVMGSVNPREFIPELISLYENGKLPLEEMITFYPFEKINNAIRDLELGTVIKAVLKL